MDEALSGWRADGHRVDGIAADVTSESGRAEIVGSIRSGPGRLDMLVNNVGTNIRKKTTEYAPAEFQKILDTNLTARGR